MRCLGYFTGAGVPRGPAAHLPRLQRRCSRTKFPALLGQPRSSQVSSEMVSCGQFMPPCAFYHHTEPAPMPRHPPPRFTRAPLAYFRCSHAETAGGRATAGAPNSRRNAAGLTQKSANPGGCRPRRKKKCARNVINGRKGLPCLASVDIMLATVARAPAPTTL